MIVYFFSPSWLYARASMSLPLLVPPISLSRDDATYFDGGITNNDPGTAARKRIGKEETILTFSLNAKERTKYNSIGLIYNGFDWLLKILWNE